MMFNKLVKTLCGGDCVGIVRRSFVRAALKALWSSLKALWSCLTSCTVITVSEGSAGNAKVPPCGFLQDILQILQLPKHAGKCQLHCKLNPRTAAPWFCLM